MHHPSEEPIVMGGRGGGIYLRERKSDGSRGILSRRDSLRSYRNRLIASDISTVTKAGRVTLVRTSR